MIKCNNTKNIYLIALCCSLRCEVAVVEIFEIRILTWMHKKLRFRSWSLHSTDYSSMGCIRQFSHSRRQLLWSLCAADLFDQRQQYKFSWYSRTCGGRKKLLQKVQKYVDYKMHWSAHRRIWILLRGVLLSSVTSIGRIPLPFHYLWFHRSIVCVCVCVCTHEVYIWVCEFVCAHVCVSIYM